MLGRIVYIIIIVVLATSFTNKDEHSAVDEIRRYKSVLDNRKAEQWADSVLKSLTIEEKIGQLFMIDAHPQKDKKHWERVANYVKDYHIGGIIFFKSGPKQLALMSNYLQEKAKIPLLISIDAEWGLGMRMDSVLSFPIQMALGAVQDNELIYQMGKTIAQHCKRLGIHINFAPVLDINNNPLNPVINVRSFGDNKKLVVEKAYEYMRGLQDEHVLAVGKHFPGHGDTQTDSHHDLPFLNFSRKRLDSLELYPFKQMIKQGIGGIMVAHLDVPALDPINKRPTTLSPEVVTDLLRNEMGFNGVIFTDALNMKGATKYFKPGELALKALQAGNDILLYPEEIPWAIQYIKEALYDSIICLEDLNEHVRRILKLKYWAGLNQCTYVDTTRIYQDLNKPEDVLLIRKLTEQSITLLKNNNSLIPFIRLDTLKMAAVIFDKKNSLPFYETLMLYAPIDTFCLSDKADSKQTQKILDTLKKYNLIFTSFHQTNRYSYRTYNITNEQLSFYKQLETLNARIVLSVFTSPYSLRIIPELKNVDALLMAYESNYYSQHIAAQILFGGIVSAGKLPVKISNHYNYLTGIKTEEVIRLKYTIPEELNISSAKLRRIDSIVNTAMYYQAFPGCQVMAIKDGKVFYHKAFGKLFYDSIYKTNLQTIYDIASVTKITATTLAVMSLYEDDKIDIHANLSEYLPFTKNTDKGSLSIGDILSHQARLTAWIPFYKTMIKDSSKKSIYFSHVYSEKYPYKVADNLYAAASMKDTILKRIIYSQLLPQKKYVYSDLGFYLMKEIVENQTKSSLDTYCSRKFYTPLGCVTTTFNPLNKFNRLRIAPTEIDNEFRQQLIWGYVHDQGASLTGGVQGHAGLFSNANDLGKIGQMLLWNGMYGGIRYFKTSTVKYFTQCYNCPQNRRGLGFDKPEPNPDKDSPVSRKVSLLTYGHQGFTGTCMWIDPKTQIVYVFLSNRVYPTAENKKINTLSIRNKILDIIYESLP
ncbi:MAG: serine hydrolase [Bacteroidales bacterium]|nr:serine hydrolase [Bacteroidales bacterium]